MSLTIDMQCIAKGVDHANKALPLGKQPRLHIPHNIAGCLGLKAGDAVFVRALNCGDINASAAHPKIDGEYVAVPQEQTGKDILTQWQVWLS